MTATTSTRMTRKIIRTMTRTINITMRMIKRINTRKKQD